MSVESGTRTRYSFIDIAKGICMISILLGHLGLDSINRVVFTYHIPVFYLIAGYFLKEDEPLYSFIKKKFRSLIIPYIIASVLIIISAVIMNLIYAQGEGLFSLVKDWCFAALYGAGDSYEKPFHIRGIGAIWFLLALFWGELFLKLILKCNPHVRPFIVALLVAFADFSRRYIFWSPAYFQSIELVKDKKTREEIIDNLRHYHKSLLYELCFSTYTHETIDYCGLNTRQMLLWKHKKRSYFLEI